MSGNRRQANIGSGSPGQAAGAEPPAAATEGILARVVRGVLWSYLSFAGPKLLVFASIVVLARLLLPVDFGQVAIVLVVVAYLDVVGDLGVGTALIYEQKRSEEAANIAFVIGLFTGFLWLLLALTFAPQVAAFFNEPAVEPMLRTMAWVFPITALGRTHDALLQRRLAFGRRLVPEFARASVKGILSVVLALMGWGAWSLVWGQLIGAAAATLALWFVVPWRPRARFPWDLAQRMLRYGGHILSVNVLAAVVHHVDYLIVGRMLGSVALGFYTMGYRVPELALTMIIWAVGKVMFPAYARLQEDAEALRQAFLATLRYLSLLTMPAGVGLAILAPRLVPALFGGNWEPSIPVLQGLALAVALRSLGTHAGDVYKATGRTHILVKVGLVRAAVLVPAVIAGTSYGIAGVAVALMVVTGASTVLNLVIVGRVLSIPLGTIMTQFKPALIGSVAMALSLQALLSVASDWPDALAVIVTVGFGIGVYAVSIWIIGRDTVSKAWTTLVSSFGKAT